MADKEIGHTGLVQYGGIIQEDFLREMRGKEGYKRYNEMRLNSAVVAAMLLAIENPLRSMSWTFSSEAENDPRVELLDTARNNLQESWNDHIVEALSTLWAGFSIFETVYEKVGGRWLWSKFAPRGQETVLRWEILPNGVTVGFWQQAPPTWTATLIPLEKCLHYRTRVERGNPEGRSILRTAWTSYYYCKHIQQTEAIGIERDLAGLPVIKLPENSSTTDDADSDSSRAAVIVRNVRNDEQAGIVLPFGWDLTLLSTGGSRQFDTDKIIRRYESRMLMSALAQFLQLGQDGVGSLALSTNQMDFFTMLVNFVADIIAETFTKQAIPRLLRLNGYDAVGIKLEHTPAAQADLTSLSDFLQKCGSYLTWDAEDEVWLREMGGLPERSVEEISAQMEQDKAAQAEALARFSQSQNQNKEQGDEETDSSKLAADYLRANEAPDAQARARMERRWGRVLAAYFEAQKKRVLKGAKELR